MAAAPGGDRGGRRAGRGRRRLPRPAAAAPAGRLGRAPDADRRPPAPDADAAAGRDQPAGRARTRSSGRPRRGRTACGCRWRSRGPPGTTPPAAGPRRSAGCPPTAAGFQFTRIAGGWAIQAKPVRPGRGGRAAGRGGAGLPYVRSICGRCAGAALPVWFLADRRAVGDLPSAPANLVAPAAGAGVVWLTSYPTGATSPTAAVTAREVSGAGAQLAPPVRLPAGAVIDTATDRGPAAGPGAPATRAHAVERSGTRPPRASAGPSTR